MARVKEWTTEDRERALQWVTNKAKTGAAFRGQTGSVEDELSTLEAITDPADLADHLRGSLTADAWKRLLNALRQRKHAEKSASEDEAAADEPSTCQSCAALQAEVERLHTDLASAIKAGELWRVEVERLQARIDELEAEPVEDSVTVTQLESTAETSGERPSALEGWSGPVVHPEVDASAQGADERPSAQTRAAKLHAAGPSLRRIAAVLNADGVPTRSGRGQWQPSTVRDLLKAL